MPRPRTTVVDDPGLADKMLCAHWRLIERFADVGLTEAHDHSRRDSRCRPDPHPQHAGLGRANPCTGWRSAQ